LTGGQATGEHEVIHVHEREELKDHADADGLIDLQFSNDPAVMASHERIKGLVMVNSVAETLAETGSAVRFNGWNGFLKSQLIEASAEDKEKKQKAEALFSAFNKSVVWLEDRPGFITPRVVCSIIAEAMLTYNEGVSTKEDINTAMRLGTNYPMGPFEWAGEIGMDNVLSLLKKLGKETGSAQQ
jgi:3-hydroxybutyryl-CoA dehydrogenase